jgi:ABC-type transport system substrate-binding protein
LITVHNNNFATETTSAWNITCHQDTNVDAYYHRLKLAASAAEQQKIAEELQRYLTEHMYWVSVSGSPHYKVHRKHVQDFHYQAEFKFLLEKVWLEK